MPGAEIVPQLGRQHRGGKAFPAGNPLRFRPFGGLFLHLGGLGRGRRGSALGGRHRCLRLDHHGLVRSHAQFAEAIGVKHQGVFHALHQPALDPVAILIDEHIPRIALGLCPPNIGGAYPTKDDGHQAEYGSLHAGGYHCPFDAAVTLLFQDIAGYFPSGFSPRKDVHGFGRHACRVPCRRVRRAAVGTDSRCGPWSARPRRSAPVYCESSALLVLGSGSMNSLVRGGHHHV